MIRLSERQAGMLALLRGHQPVGYAAKEANPTLNVLRREGLAEFRGTRAKPRVLSWHITDAGSAWLEERRAADLAEGA